MIRRLIKLLCITVVHTVTEVTSSVSVADLHGYRVAISNGSTTNPHTKSQPRNHFTTSASPVVYLIARMVDMAKTAAQQRCATKENRSHVHRLKPLISIAI